MTTEQIRKNIHVAGYGLYDLGLKVSYTWYSTRNEKGEERTLILVRPEALEELNAMGEVNTNDWEWIADNYNLSQWDALNLVIRHEYRQSVKSDTSMLEIDKALEELKNS
jgi:hypothetical protein